MFSYVFGLILMAFEDLTFKIEIEGNLLWDAGLEIKIELN